MPPADRPATSSAEYGSMSNTDASEAFNAETLGPNDHHLHSEAQKIGAVVNRHLYLRPHDQL